MIRRIKNQNEPMAEPDESVREDLARLRAILNTAVDAIITINHLGVITAINPATLKLFGYSEGELIGRNVGVLMPEPFRGEHDGYLRRYLESGQARIIGTRRELTAMRKDGSTFPIELVVGAFHDAAGPIFTGIIHDITRRRELEMHLAQARIEEQQRVARELHDGLGGQMTGIGLLVKALRNKLEAEGSHYVPQMSELAKQIEVAHAQVRAISRGLSPVEMMPDGLSSALEELAHRTDQADGIRCSFQTDGTPVYDPTVAANLYRIAQEAVSNAVRHAQPRKIDIQIEQEHGNVVLAVSNDGHAFEHFPDSDRGMGILTMKHRANLIGGELWITPGEGGGAVVVCRAPNLQTRHDNTH